MAAQVFLGQAHHFLPAQDIDVDLGHVQRGALGGPQQRVGAGVDRGLLAPHLVLRGETVEHHLLQTQAGLAPGHGLPVIVTGGAGSGVVGAFAAITAQQVDGRQVATLGGTQLLVGRKAAIDPGLHFRMDIHRALHGFGKALGMDRQAGSQGEREQSGEAQTHVLGILFVDFKVRKLHRYCVGSSFRIREQPHTE
ncbi:hypothetical protein FQZ97_856690 [compost metagenome]